MSNVFKSIYSISIFNVYDDNDNTDADVDINVYNIAVLNIAL